MILFKQMHIAINEHCNRVQPFFQQGLIGQGVLAGLQSQMPMSIRASSEA